MKTKSLLTIFAAVAALQFAPMALAQEADAGDHPRRGRYAMMLANLSPDERAKLRLGETPFLQRRRYAEAVVRHRPPGGIV